METIGHTSSHKTFSQNVVLISDITFHANSTKKL
jgi:hypothetical protein